MGSDGYYMFSEWKSTETLRGRKREAGGCDGGLPEHKLRLQRLEGHWLRSSMLNNINTSATLKSLR
jgi:hypothetical protein